MSRILICCEHSGVVREAFRGAGHDAWSCDILPASDASLFHFQADCVTVIPQGWDLIVMHPPCTAIALCGNSTYGRGMPKHGDRLSALDWTESLWRLACRHSPRVALENPKNVLGARIGPKTQTVHPWQFGHMEQKETWLWLNGLPPLLPTQNVYEDMMKLPRKQRERIHFMSPSSRRGHERSITFSGIARAMAETWGP
jgi:hypothetical protein